MQLLEQMLMSAIDMVHDTQVARVTKMEKEALVEIVPCDLTTAEVIDPVEVIGKEDCDESEV